MCRLGEGLAETGAIAAENFRRGVEAVRRFRAIADAMGATRIDATATEAVRRATNGPDFVAAVAEEAGIELRVLTGAEEAHFAAQGVISGLFRPVGLVGDMGGGSLEVAEALDDRVGERTVSLPLGALPVQSLLKRGTDEAKAGIDTLLRENLPPVLTEPVFYAVGGGFRALAKAHLWASRAPIHVVHGHTAACGRDQGVRQEALASGAGEAGPDARGGYPPGAHASGRGHRARSGDQASRSGARRVLRARVCARAGSMRSCRPPSAISTRSSRGRGCSGCPSPAFRGSPQH